MLSDLGASPPGPPHSSATEWLCDHGEAVPLSGQFSLLEGGEMALGRGRGCPSEGPPAPAPCGHLCPGMRELQNPAGREPSTWAQLAPAQVRAGAWKAPEASWAQCLGVGLLPQAVK